MYCSEPNKISVQSPVETSHSLFEFFMRFSITTVSGALSLAEKTYLTSKVRGRSWEDPRPKGGAAKRSYPTSKARGSGQEEQPHVQGGWAVWGQEGLEELSHLEGQEGRW